MWEAGAIEALSGANGYQVEEHEAEKSAELPPAARVSYVKVRRTWLPLLFGDNVKPGPPQHVGTVVQ